MDCFIKDVKAFYELSDDSNVTKDFTKFSKLDVPSAVSINLKFHILQIE